MVQLDEATRKELIDKSKSADIVKAYGTTRYDRRNLQHISKSVSSFNKIDFNALFRANLLSFRVPVKGETSTYEIELLFEGICDDIKHEIQMNNDLLDYKCIYRAIIDAVNRLDIMVSCSCLSGDTKITLLDGQELEISKVKDLFDSGSDMWVYSSDSNGDFRPGHVSNVFITKYVSDVVETILDNGEVITTTPDHLFMMRDGSYKLAGLLLENDSLMPMYFNEASGYRLVKLNSKVRGWNSIYKEVAKYIYPLLIALKEEQAIQDKLNGIDNMADCLKVAIHHKDFNKLNNSPDNLQIMTAYEHRLYHANNISRLWNDESFRLKSSERASLRIKKLNANPTEAMIKARVELGKKNSKILNSPENIEKFHDIRSNTMRLSNLNRSQEDNDKLYASVKASWDGEGRLNHLRKRASHVIDRILQSGEIPSPATYDKYKFVQNPKWQSCFSSWDELSNYFNINHKVKSVKFVHLDNPIPVYDLTVDKWNNFRVSAGVILHNCPDWKYRQAYSATKQGYNSGLSELRPAKITNPNDTAGAGCKHVMTALGNLDWALKLASSIYNYICYMEEHDTAKFVKVIFPTIFDIPYEDYSLDKTQYGVGDQELANTMNGPEEDQEVVDAANDREEPEEEIPEEEVDENET